MSDLIEIPDEEEFKLLLTLCAHDFRHDFMNTSDRVNAGFIRGFSGGSSKSPSKSKSSKSRKPSGKKNRVVTMAVYLNDIFFLNSLREQKVKQKKGEAKKRALIKAMQNSVDNFNIFIRFLKAIVNADNKHKKATTKMKSRQTSKVESALVSPLGALKRAMRKSNKKNKKKRTRRKKQTRGGSSQPDIEGLQQVLKKEIKELKKSKAEQEQLPHPLVASAKVVVTEAVGPMRNFEFIGHATGDDAALPYDLVHIGNDGELGFSYEEYLDHLEIDNIDEYIKSLSSKATTGSIEAEHIEELEQVKEEISVRRSSRAKKAAFYGDNVDTRIYDDWCLKYDNYYELYPVVQINETLPPDAIKIRSGNEFNDLLGFSKYHSNISKKMKNARFNFNTFIQWLNSQYPEVVPLAVAPKLSSESAKVVKDFGKKVSKYWWSFITGDEIRAKSPAMTPPSRPVLTNTGKLLSKMLHSTFNATSSDATVLRIFKDYFNDTTLDTTMSGRPSWDPNGLLINNASQLKLHKKIFGSRNEGNCYVPSVLDAMSNCPRLSQERDVKSDIDIKVTCSEDKYIQYNVTDISDTQCTVSFEFKNGTKIIKNSLINTNYKAKALSVVNVLNYLILLVKEAQKGIKGPTIDDRISKFNEEISKNPEILSAIILPVFCLKLFGDLGQELFAVAKNGVFVSNDRPSAMRYILMKKNKLEGGGGGGYFPNKVKDVYYI